MDRQITGQDWLQQPIASQTDIQRVLVLDLDLESPGIGHSLLPESNSPDFGIIDWLVEEAVGQADESLLRELVGTSPLVSSGIGDIRIVPASGIQEKPDIVLLDSRAGMHDIAAITITRLNAYALLFAINTPQTWRGYRLLFQHWQRWHPNLAQFRDNLKIVAGMVPEIDRANYLKNCRQSAYDLTKKLLKLLIIH